MASINSPSYSIISRLTSSPIPGTNPSASKSRLPQWSEVVVRPVAAVAASAANVRRREGAVDPVASGAGLPVSAGVAGVAAVDDADILRTGLLYYSKKLGFGGLLWDRRRRCRRCCDGQNRGYVFRESGFGSAARLTAIHHVKLDAQKTLEFAGHYSTCHKSI